MMDERNTGPSLREAGEKVRADVDALRGAALREEEEILARVRDFVEEHPFGAVGAAAAAGYALSGALFSRTTLRLFALSARFYLGRLIEARLGDGAGRTGMGHGGAAPAPRAG